VALPTAGAFAVGLPTVTLADHGRAKYGAVTERIAFATMSEPFLEFPVIRQSIKVRLQ
jgi:hypothetical protein